MHEDMHMPLPLDTEKINTKGLKPELTEQVQWNAVIHSHRAPSILHQVWRQQRVHSMVHCSAAAPTAMEAAILWQLHACRHSHGFLIIFHVQRCI